MRIACPLKCKFWRKGWIKTSLCKHAQWAAAYPGRRLKLEGPAVSRLPGFSLAKQLPAKLWDDLAESDLEGLDAPLFGVRARRVDPGRAIDHQMKLGNWRLPTSNFRPSPDHTAGMLNAAHGSSLLAKKNDLSLQAFMRLEAAPEISQ